MRFCECGRELEKYCRLCSECRAINDQIAKDIYVQSEKGIQSQDKYNKSEKGVISRRRAVKKWDLENIELKRKIKQEWNIKNKDRIKEYNRSYYENRH
jgi:hypothetical protein